jgi:hypothetical protein
LRGFPPFRGDQRRVDYLQFERLRSTYRVVANAHPDGIFEGHLDSAMSVAADASGDIVPRTALK